MNKKFSTLMTVALLTGSFTMSINASTVMSAAPAAIETRAVASTALDVTNVPSDVNIENITGMLNGFTNNSRLVVFVKAADGTITNVTANEFLKMDAGSGKMAAYATTDAPTIAAYYWSMDGSSLKDQNGLTLSLGNEQVFEVVPVKNNGVKQPYFLLKVVSGANADKYITCATANTWAVDADKEKAALFASVETAYTSDQTADDLNAILGTGSDAGFELSIAKAAGNTATVTGANLFGGVLTAVDATPTAGTFYQLKNSDGKFIVLNTNDKTNLSDPNAQGKFKVVAAANVGDAGYMSFFKIAKADNGAEGVVVYVADDKDGNVAINTTTSNSPSRLYVATTGDSNVLSIADPENVDAKSWAYAKLAGDNAVDLKTLLKGQFVKVNYVKTGKETTTNKYKVGGILSVRDDESDGTNEADYVASSSVIASAPEAQWALTYDGTNLTLTNRENTDVDLVITGLRTTDKANVYKVAATGTNINGDLITISFVENHTKTDGYMVEADNVLRNTTYYLGQSRQTADGDINAYWAENHGTHQIGATVDKDLATKWNLGLIKKASTVNSGKNVTEIDSVLVVSTMNVWNDAKKELTEKKDTLVVLPYAFQNRENREFVKLNDETNLEYYICDENNLDNEGRTAWRFALKMKPNGTYNYVVLGTNTYTGANIKETTAVGDKKVYQANSTDKGTWADMYAYAGDDNALMVVEKTADPEYRKVKVEWGDTISIYRQENDAQKLYEKADNKSVVNNDTLSFLNIDNDYQFKMNPAIFVDTAYVNRGTGDDANTCYQYLLVVEPSFGYHKDGCGVPGHPQTVGAIDTVYGRFLVNLIDTANIYGATHLHNNPYINKIEADENLAKLSFVEGYHTGDKLYIPRQNNTDTLKLDMNSPAFNVAKFAFRYVDNEAGTFKIQTQWKEYAPAKEEKDRSKSQEGYLRWVNGTVVVTNGYTNGDVFNMNESVKLDPVANETINAASSISVIAGNGTITVKGAAGKKVAISNVLGQTIANTVVTSDEATIAAPAGVVVVAVEGEAAVKAIVK